MQLSWIIIVDLKLRYRCWSNNNNNNEKIPSIRKKCVRNVLSWRECIFAASMRSLNLLVIFLIRLKSNSRFGIYVFKCLALLVKWLSLVGNFCMCAENDRHCLGICVINRIPRIWKMALLSYQFLEFKIYASYMQYSDKIQTIHWKCCT